MNRLTPHKGSVNRIGNLLGFNNASNQAEQPHVGHLHRSTRLDKLNFIDVQTLNQKYRKTARRIWNRQYELSERKCSQCRDCRMRDDNPKKKKEEDPSWNCLPMRNTSKTLLCGCVLQLWDVYAPTVVKGNPNGRRGGGGGRGRYGRGAGGGDPPVDVETASEEDTTSSMVVVRATISAGRDKGKQICGLIIGNKKSPPDHVAYVRQTFLDAKSSFKERQEVRQELAAEEMIQRQKEMKKMMEERTEEARQRQEKQAKYVAAMAARGVNVAANNTYARQQQQQVQARNKYQFSISQTPIHYYISTNMNDSDRNMPPLQYSMGVEAKRCSNDWWRCWQMDHTGRNVCRYLPNYEDMQLHKRDQFSSIQPPPLNHGEASSMMMDPMAMLNSLGGAVGNVFANMFGGGGGSSSSSSSSNSSNSSSSSSSNGKRAHEGSEQTSAKKSKSNEVDGEFKDSNESNEIDLTLDSDDDDFLMMMDPMAMLGDDLMMDQDDDGRLNNLKDSY